MMPTIARLRVTPFHFHIDVQADGTRDLPTLTADMPPVTMTGEALAIATIGDLDGDVSVVVATEPPTAHSSELIYEGPLQLPNGRLAIGHTLAEEFKVIEVGPPGTYAVRVYARARRNKRPHSIHVELPADSEPALVPPAPTAEQLAKMRVNRGLLVAVMTIVDTVFAPSRTQRRTTQRWMRDPVACIRVDLDEFVVTREPPWANEQTAQHAVAAALREAGTPATDRPVDPDPSVWASAILEMICFCAELGRLRRWQHHALTRQLFEAAASHPGPLPPHFNPQRFIDALWRGQPGSTPQIDEVHDNE